MDRPRFHFAGRFRCDISTINNVFNNFNSATFSPVNEVVMDNNNARFNPLGTAAFDFYNTYITSVCSATEADCSTEDLLVGSSIDTAMSAVSAKMVDIDVEMQSASKIFGLNLGVDGYLSNPPVMKATFHPAAFTNLWPLVVNSQGGFIAMAARYQSYLNVDWNNDLLAEPDDPNKDKYKILRQLKETSPDVLSVSFTTYIYNTNDSNTNWTYGYVVGTVGPGTVAEPENYIRERFFRFADGESSTGDIIFSSQFKVTSSSLTVDFSNALSRRLVDGDFVLNTEDLGSELCIYTQTTDAELGRIELSEQWFQTTAGIQQFQLPSQYTNSVNQEYLKVVKCTDQTVLMVETENVVRPTDTFVQWMNPGESVDKTFFVTNKGVPQCNYAITFQVHLVQDNIPWNKREQARNAIKVNDKETDTVYTNCTGFATVTLTATDPGIPRDFVDGCVLVVSFTSDDGLFSDSSLLIRLFSDFPYDSTAKGKPSWYGENGVYSIFQQYDNLYPIMRKIVRLGDYNSVTDPRNIQYIKMAMELPFDHPSFMPVTRDLSQKKKQMILDWLNQDYPPKKGKRGKMEIEDLRKNLQLAIQVEHSTIPVYMYAMYSIKEGYNEEIAEIIKSVAIDEMLHMALAANLLISVGGSPDFVSPDFIPVYPSRMPGGLHPALELRLSPLSISLVRDVFMHIETPKYLTEEDEHPHNDTIGGFYKRLRKNLKRLEKEANEQGESIFGHADQQVQYNLPGHLEISKVTNLDEALSAIDLIAEQGEGSSQIDPRDEYEQLAHYFKFKEIVEGHHIFRKPNGNLEFIGESFGTVVYYKNFKHVLFLGAPVTLDMNGVWPLPHNPRTFDYPKNSRARMLAEGFGRHYLDMLNQLHIVFNGQPDDIISAFSAMFLLNIRAKEMVAVPIKTGEPSLHAGPTFDNPLHLFYESKYL